jgi:hyperosmotically inducible protein
MSWRNVAGGGQLARGVYMSAESRTRPAAGAAGKIGAPWAAIAALMIATSALGGCALAMLNGAASSGGGSSAPAPARSRTDDAISTSVRSKLAADPVLKAFNLSVDTHDGVVTLRGQVAKVEQRNAALADARSVAGVKSVQSLITVKQ